jgi:ferrous iron transport protein A
MQSQQPSLDGQRAGRVLAHAPIGVPFAVRAVHPPEHAPEWRRALEDIGFYPGERVMVMARGLPGADPLAVRVGQSTFALRAAEAACIEIEADTAGAQA